MILNKAKEIALIFQPITGGFYNTTYLSFAFRFVYLRVTIFESMYFVKNLMTLVKNPMWGQVHNLINLILNIFQEQCLGFVREIF